jgi:hypothetical protein
MPVGLMIGFFVWLPKRMVRFPLKKFVALGSEYGLLLPVPMSR